MNLDLNQDLSEKLLPLEAIVHEYVSIAVQHTPEAIEVDDFSLDFAGITYKVITEDVILPHDYESGRQRSRQPQYLRRISNGGSLLVELVDPETQNNIKKANRKLDKLQEEYDQALENRKYGKAAANIQKIYAMAQQQFQQGWLFRDETINEHLPWDREKLIESYAKSTNMSLNAPMGDTLTDLAQTYIAVANLAQEHQVLAQAITLPEIKFQEKKQGIIDAYYSKADAICTWLAEARENKPAHSLAYFGAMVGPLDDVYKSHSLLNDRLELLEREKLAELTILMPQLAQFVFNGFKHYLLNVFPEKKPGLQDRRKALHLTKAMSKWLDPESRKNISEVVNDTLAKGKRSKKVNKKRK